MSLLLGFDTSEKDRLSVALLRGACVLSHEVISFTHAQQSEGLQSALEGVLKAEGAGWQDLEFLGVGTGPGNFTASRAGIAFARGLGLARKIPIRGVSGFEALAWGAPCPLLVLIKAPGDSVYAQLFSECPPNAASDAPLTPPAQVLLNDLPAFIKTLCQDMCAPKYLVCADPLLSQEISERFGLAIHPACACLGLNIAHYARHAFLHDDHIAPERPAPLYLRPPNATPYASSPKILASET